jgi:hypothetical protein
MRVFKSKWFERFARKNGIGDEALRVAVEEIEAGNINADLGGNVYKQRVARQGQGKRGGYRTIVLLKQGERAFFVYGFAKSERDNIGNNDLVEFKELAKLYFSYTTEEIDTAIAVKKFFEIVGDVYEKKI